jgi:hypothetical protein
MRVIVKGLVVGTLLGRAHKSRLVGGNWSMAGLEAHCGLKSNIARSPKSANRDMQGLRPRPYSWHSLALGGAAHSIRSGYSSSHQGRTIYVWLIRFKARLFLRVQKRDLNSHLPV